MSWFRKERPYKLPPVEAPLAAPKPATIPERLADIPYEGTRFRICTSSPDHWWIEQFKDAAWERVREYRETHSPYRPWDEFPVAFNTKDKCKAWIDVKVSEWRRCRHQEMTNAAHVAANPPEEYP